MDIEANDPDATFNSLVEFVKTSANIPEERSEEVALRVLCAMCVCCPGFSFGISQLGLGTSNWINIKEQPEKNIKYNLKFKTIYLSSIFF